MTSHIMIILQKEHTHAYNIRKGLLLQGEKLQPNHLLFKSTFIKNHVHKVDPTFIKNCKIHVYKANNIQLTNKKSCTFIFTGSLSLMPGFGHVINLNLIEGKGHQSESSHCHILDNISCMKRANT